MCSSLDGSHSRAATSTAAIFAQAMRSLPTAAGARTAPQDPSRAIAPAPDKRRRTGASVRCESPFKRTGTVTCSLPSEQPGCSGAPISRRASARASNAPVLIKLAKLRHRLLNDAPPDAHAPHQTPIAVDLAVLPASRVAQVHAPIRNHSSAAKEIPKVVTTRAKSPFRAVQPLDPTLRHLPQNRNIHTPTAQVRLEGERDGQGSQD